VADLAEEAAGSVVATALATLAAVWALAVLAVQEVVAVDNSMSPMSVPHAPDSFGEKNMLTWNLQLPFNVGWQDLKDLFRQACMCALFLDKLTMNLTLYSSRRNRHSSRRPRRSYRPS
jgi:hypothetical protein